MSQIQAAEPATVSPTDACFLARRIASSGTEQMMATTALKVMMNASSCVPSWSVAASCAWDPAPSRTRPRSTPGVEPCDRGDGHHPDPPPGAISGRGGSGTSTRSARADRGVRSPRSDDSTASRDGYARPARGKGGQIFRRIGTAITPTVFRGKAIVDLRKRRSS
jgi:hypothetical protein